MSVKKIDLFRGKAEIQKSLIQSVFIHNRGDAKVEKKNIHLFLALINSYKAEKMCVIMQDIFGFCSLSHLKYLNMSAKCVGCKRQR